ncbi:hypothetical protein VL15_07195 [Burkholderia cepacia]|uniref:Uncharacterized protein n=1 Tax=Burkholderia cepacia TaxID=292 RepID=A0A0J6A540_BURCE|nr:hypothetical protein [Burkholderia cepacia]KML60890.1 hypothetical protein VL15_07195 [Burkholderia cepacia]
MSLKSDAIEVTVTVVVVGGLLWYAARKVGGGLSSLGSSISDAASAAGGAIADGASTAWTTAGTPVVPNDTGIPAVDGAANLANGIVSAPSSALDGLSMGLIGGSGGSGGNGGLAGWLMSIIDGSYFAPKQTPDPTFDAGNGSGW